MNILKTVKKNPWTTVVAVLTAVTGAWQLLSENADLIGIPAKVFSIGFLVLTIGMMVVNQFNNQD